MAPGPDPGGAFHMADLRDKRPFRRHAVAAMDRGACP